MGEGLVNILSITPIPSAGRYVVNDNMVFFFFVKGQTRSIYIAKDTYIDSESPTPFHPKRIVPFIIYNLVYRDAGLFFVKKRGDNRYFMSLTRKEADILLFKMLQYFEVHPLICIMTYLINRITGWKKWRMYRKRSGRECGIY